ncbi:MAG TPA: methyltransferase domain-containing protein [Parachlamydiaceae bacterium]|nr:methyltransferase domain-containing protein [Parachlamydiaceae bacterium]
MIKTNRSYEHELLDLGPAYYSQEEYDHCLVQLARIGRYLGGNSATLDTLNKFPGITSIIDIGCGGGQFAIQLGQEFPDAAIMGIDISSQAIEFSKTRLSETNVKNVQFKHSTDLRTIGSNSFDIVTSTLVCHHLNDEQLIDFLKQSYRISKQAVVINDLHRHWLAYYGFALIATLFFPNRLIYHDGLLSIKRAFSKQEWMDYLKAADIPWEKCSLTWHWAFRWILRIDSSSKSGSSKGS